MIVLLYLYFICGDLFFIVTQDFVIRREYIKDFDCLFRKKNNKFIIYGLCWIVNILDVVIRRDFIKDFDFLYIIVFYKKE